MENKITLLGAFDRIQTIDYLIRIKGTGSPVKLAARLGISNRTVFDWLNLLRTLGTEIKYDRKRSSYYYVKPGGFSFKFSEQN